MHEGRHDGACEWTSANVPCNMIACCAYLGGWEDCCVTYDAMVALS